MFADLFINGKPKFYLKLKMKQHLVTVCIVCILCATHAPCSAHQQDSISPSPLEMGSKGTVQTGSGSGSRDRHNLPEWDSQVSNIILYDKNRNLAHILDNILI